MNIRAKNGRLYDPDVSTLIGKRVISDGSIQRLHRTKNGSYFFYITDANGNKLELTPTTYDKALKWAEEYGNKEMIRSFMTCSDNKIRHCKVKIKEYDLSRLELIAKKNSLTLKDTLKLIALQYMKGENVNEKE